MDMESAQMGAPDSGLTWQTFGIAFGLHVALFLVILLVGLFNAKKSDNAPKENIVPIDLMIVPPWAKQTDDPNPDPNPPKKAEKQRPKPPPKAPEVKKNVDLKSKNALVKVDEKKKPEMKRGDLKKDKKLQRAKPQKIEKSERKAPDVERPPDPKLQKIMENLKAGKGTAAEKPMPDIDLNKMLNQGYRIGAHNQIATSEAQRCASLIKAAIDREWQKESFNWYSGLRSIEVDFQLGAGGVVRGFAIKSGSGDASVDGTALNALRRLKEKGGIPGLSKSFIEQFPRLTITMEPTQGR